MKTIKLLFLLFFILQFQFSAFGQQTKQVTKETLQQNKDDDDDDDDDDCDDDDDDDDKDDNCIIKHPSLFFVKLNPSITEAEVDLLLDELNADEIWHRPEINLRLWDTRMFPYTNTAGQSVTNIDRQIAGAQGKTGVDGVDFNIGHIVPRTPVDIPGVCFQNMAPKYPVGNNPIKISIFDTGYTPVAGSFPGYSFIIPEYTGYDYIDDDQTPEDLNGHGTHIAGVVHHLLSYGGGPSSVSFDIRKTHDAQGQGFVSNLIPAILDAVNEGADILNFSFSYQNKNVNTVGKPLRLAVDYAEQMGALVIAAAGNTNENNDSDGIISFPASYPNNNILSVASTSCDKKLSPFSSYGQFSVDVGILGDNIPGPGLNGAVAYQSGTSFATANVTAMSAILATYQTTFNYQNIKCSLINTSTTSSDMFEKVVSNGILNFTAAFNQIDMGCNSTNVNKAIKSLTKKESFLFPNPFNETLQLQIKGVESKKCIISIYNQTGVLLMQDDYLLNNKTTVVQLTKTQQLTPGVYFIKMNTENISKTEVVIKNK